jgi:hypothetical protein
MNFPPGSKLSTYDLLKISLTSSVFRCIGRAVGLEEVAS